MDLETKKAAELGLIAGVGHVVASKPALKPIVRYRADDIKPTNWMTVMTNAGLAFVDPLSNRWYIATERRVPITWWAYLPEDGE